ncbi:MAG: transglycosylase SLT domain-containing protein [Candidatus Magasanikbacteria bacterium]|nr:transglycosylase SLT domain-containing protein [Candidatus Magasanikbacteria bacterium]
MKKIFFITAFLLLFSANTAHASFYIPLFNTCTGLVTSPCDSNLNCSEMGFGGLGRICIPNTDYSACGNFGDCTKNTGSGNTKCVTVQSIKTGSELKYDMTCLNTATAPQASNANSAVCDTCKTSEQCVKVFADKNIAYRCIDVQLLPPKVLDMGNGSCGQNAQCAGDQSCVENTFTTSGLTYVCYTKSLIDLTGSCNNVSGQCAYKGGGANSGTCMNILDNNAKTPHCLDYSQLPNSPTAPTQVVCKTSADCAKFGENQYCLQNPATNKGQCFPQAAIFTDMNQLPKQLCGTNDCTCGAPGTTGCNKNISDPNGSICLPYIDQAGVTICANNAGNGAILGTGSGAASANSTSAITPTVPNQTYTAYAPKLEISIPNLTFVDKITAEDSSVAGLKRFSIPYLATYINAAYKYAIGMAVLAAVLMMMYAGFRWMSSFGNEKAVTEAKSLLSNAALGLFMVFSAYTILYFINPNLTNLSSLQILAPKQEVFNIEDLTFSDEDHTSQGTEENVTVTPSEYDNMFQLYATCSGINWQLMKAVAQHESGLKAAIHNPNSSAVGLFQAMAGKDNKTCKNVLRAVNLDAKCNDPGLTDPTLNTAYASLIFKVSVGKINALCSSATTEDKIFLMYFAHSSGPGAMGAGVKQYGCNPVSNGTAWPESGTLWPDGTPYKLSGKKVYNGASKSYINKIVKKATSIGVTNFSGPKNPTSCPLHT